MQELLNPEMRLPKISMIAEPIVIDGPALPGRQRCSSRSRAAFRPP